MAGANDATEPKAEGLPVETVLPALKAALAAGRRAVLTAEPGAGKTTRVPLALLDEDWLSGQRILMLAPRRIAARACAQHMARLLGEAVGETIGYRVRHDHRVSARTRVEIVTEGVLTRLVQRDPALEGYGLVIFDEFHERSLESDLALALSLEAAGALRPDLALLVMSATMDSQAVATLLGGAPTLAAEGRLHPVDVRYRPGPRERRLDDHMASIIREALASEPGSLLAFLPGEAEIERTAERLGALGPGITVHTLYGALPIEAQQDAIRIAPAGQRKVVLATPIAETSLTIEGVRLVVDGGFKRVPHFDPSTGMTRLKTVRVSRAAARQRQGRAGRLEPGVCYRLWAEPEERAFAAMDTPEILQADLAPFALELALWGVRDPSSLALLDAPPEGPFAEAQSLLRSLGALDPAGAITPEGRALAALPLHPRLGHMVLRGQALGAGQRASEIAALLAERPVSDMRKVKDLGERLSLMRTQNKSDATRRQEASARQIRAEAGIRGADLAAVEPGVLVALAYPDRIAMRRGAGARYRLSGGGGAVLEESDALARASFLAVAETDGAPGDARIFLAAPLTRQEIDSYFATALVSEERVGWDDARARVVATRVERLGALVLDERPLADPDPATALALLLEAVRARGPAGLPWSNEARALQARVSFLGAIDPSGGWPDLSDDALLATLSDWLAPTLAGAVRFADVEALDLLSLLRARLDRDQLRRLDAFAPTRLTVPSGATLAIDYAAEGGPTLRVRLQELFGWRAAPPLAGGRVALRLELLSPAGRPIAITNDLARFWATGYAAVRADLRGRYPKHAWPEDPLSATAPRPGRAR